MVTLLAGRPKGNQVLKYVLFPLIKLTTTVDHQNDYRPRDHEDLTRIKGKEERISCIPVRCRANRHVLHALLRYIIIFLRISSY